MNKTKLNHQIWMLANAIQGLSHVNDLKDSSINSKWLEDAIEDIEDVLKNLKEELPF